MPAATNSTPDRLDNATPLVVRATRGFTAGLVQNGSAPGDVQSPGFDKEPLKPQGK